MRRKPLLLSLVAAFVLGGWGSCFVMQQIGTSTTKTPSIELLGTSETTKTDETQVAATVQDALATAKMVRVEVPKTGGSGEFQGGVSLVDTVETNNSVASTETVATVVPQRTSIAIPLALAILGLAILGILGYFTYQHFMR